MPEEQTGSITVKIASQEEFEKIHELNHQTFAIEIPQHEKRPDGKLIDVFHEKNTYIVALEGDELVGMICYNPIRPFSLDKKLNNLDEYLPDHRKLVELRLFAVKKDKRKQGIAISMLKVLIPDLIGQGYDLGVISGSVNELELYKNIGSVPFGPLVGTEKALYQPLYFHINNLKGAFKVL
ncbi:GNAT family N-acetyltransferase [Segetibacter sp. 3557_3]|uniref:GNAT family N-acetyltransferase n=1 Tax=Segetibacter sp. 3557_3 TaxID=2547429 RepID=UPI00105859E5|nr:GNAT family N-acetyltransferase [Segetibacter sp. 3557_3]TDH24606.1 GNAT family N-acetyltransferase [Segetibacter sp. 3557_3]